MSRETDPTGINLTRSSAWGIARGILVHTLIYPLEVVKIRQQCLKNPEKGILIARRIFQQEGFGAFYKGLFPQLIKTSLKQIWCWPMMINMPIFLQHTQFGDLQQQAITGVSIATIDAAITTPLERIKIVTATTGKITFSLEDIFKEGWKGVITHWSKLSTTWVTFLVAQKHLRDRHRSQQKQPLSHPLLLKIGLQVALIVSLVSAPFDMANTLKQAKNQSILDLLLQKGISKWYRGWPLSALSLIIHNVASVTLMEKLQIERK